MGIAAKIDKELAKQTEYSSSEPVSKDGAHRPGVVTLVDSDSLQARTHVLREQLAVSWWLFLCTTTACLNLRLGLPIHGGEVLDGGALLHRKSVAAQVRRASSCIIM